MGQLTKSLRKTTNGFLHWCPACHDIHPLPDSWSFNGNIDKPSFQPSFKHEANKIIRDETGKWTGEWELTPDGKPVRYICHYILTDGILHFCPDSTHSFAGKSVPLADLPPYFQDENDEKR